MKVIVSKFYPLLALLLLSSCRFVPYFLPEDSVVYLYADCTQIDTGGDKARITVVGFTAEGEAVRNYTRVLLSTNIGTIPPYVDLIDGRGEVEFRSGSQRGTAVINAWSGNIDPVALEIQIGPGDLAYLTIRADPAQLPPRGGESDITVTAFDADQNPLSGVPIALTTDAGYLEGGSGTQFTDAAGKVVDRLNTNATAKVTAKSGTVEQSVTVRVETNQKPTAQFYFSPMSPKKGEEVTFNGSYSHDPDGRIVSWQWNFGDGSEAGGEVVKHAFTWTGTETKSFTVVLRVFDDGGDFADITKTITVTALTAIAVRFSVTGLTGEANGLIRNLDLTTAYAQYPLWVAVSADIIDPRGRMQRQKGILAGYLGLVGIGGEG